MTDQTTNEEPTDVPPAATHRETRQGLLLPIGIPIGAFVVIGLVLFGFSRVLLSVSANAATAVALVVAITIMVVATIVSSRERLSNGALFSMVGAVAGVAMLAGGIAIVTVGSGEETGGGKVGGQSEVVALTAPKGAAATGFEPTTLSVEANRPIELDFSNMDPGIQHNVVIFDVDPAKNPDAKPIFSGSLVTGPGTTPYDVPPLPPGTYFFHCIVHPGTMIGTIESAEGGGGGGGLTVTAKSLAFSTDEIDLPAGQPTTITFDNQDAGVPHNIAIYRDDSLSEPLFQGEQFPGVDTRKYEIPPLEPGTYFFHCDVHPVMSGTVVVAPPGGGATGAASEPPPGGPGGTGATGPSPSG